MRDPFKIDGPAIISFSGGRTSAYMLWRVLQSWSGTLPNDVKVCFANTGKEMPETLDFVRDCGERWSVEVMWLEYVPNEDKSKRWRFVDYKGASRNGEPFSNLIAQKGYLPNPLMRFCTHELKIRPMRDFARSLGWGNWDVILGLRADEPQRVAKLGNNRDPWDSLAPLATAGITKEHVGQFWAAQSFDLRLQSINGVTPLGNCSACFLKSSKRIARILLEHPEEAAWWVGTEERAYAQAQKKAAAANDEDAKRKHLAGGRFRIDRPTYQELWTAAKNQTEMTFDLEIDQRIDCMCSEDQA